MLPRRTQGEAGPNIHKRPDTAYVFGNEIGQRIASIKTAWSAARTRRLERHDAAALQRFCQLRKIRENRARQRVGPAASWTAELDHRGLCAVRARSFRAAIKARTP